MRDDAVRMVIGTATLIGRRGVLSSGSYLEIGAYCLLAPQVYVASAEHLYEPVPFRPLMNTGIRDYGSIIVEENCWLGINSVVSGPIRIGRGSVVGANAVVRQNVPPFSVVVGQPARIVRMFDPESGSWRAVRRPEDRTQVEEARRRSPLPSREAYAEFLGRIAGGRGIDPIVAGRGQHLE
jgi:acetyltransferase-like isoleucine patch superfamily enzyme